MAKSHLKQQIPAGVKDLLPEEAWRKREAENLLAALFHRWGYREVVTPTFEYYEALVTGRGAEQEEQIYKFLDRQGHILTLRPDMTTPIARLVATRMKEEPLPLRLFYIANVFSYEDPQAGRQREFYQAGVEFIGSAEDAADAEVIALAVEAMQKSGLRNFKVTVGQVDVFNGLVEELKLKEAEIKRIKSTVANKNFVGLEELLDEFRVAPADRDRFLRVMTLHGGAEVLATAAGLMNNRKSRDALQNLGRVKELLDQYNVADHVSYDLGLLRGLDYYTGIVFEGYTTALGFPVCGGGRYDRLLGQFACPAPATGFALGLERLLMALERNGEEALPVYDYLIGYAPGRSAEALQKAGELRQAGFSVEVNPMGEGRSAADEYARKRRIGSVLFID